MTGVEIRVARIDGLRVLDDRQRQDTATALELSLEKVKPDPQVIGVEELVAADVLEAIRIAISTLGGLSQSKPPPLRTCQVPALAVGLRPPGNLHQKRRARFGKIA